MNQKIALQHGKCALCGEKFTDYNDVVPDHISPRGMDGAWRDDHPANIQAVHWWCNGEKADRIGRFLRMMEARVQYCRTEAARLQDRARSCDRKVTQTKNMVMFYIQSRDLKKIE